MIPSMPHHHVGDAHMRCLLENELSDSETASILEHLEHCASCRSRLDAMAAAPESWLAASSYLSSSDGSVVDNPYALPFNAYGSDANDADRDDGRGNHRSSNGRQAGERRLPAPKIWNDSPLVWSESMAKELLSPPSHPEMLGRIGRYEVERWLGAGGMGIVFKAFDTELHRPVAIKLLAPYLAHSAAARVRFAREAKAAAAVVHEHVVPIYNVESEGSLPYMVMHYVAGESLQHRLDREGSLPLCETLRIGMQIASGLAAAHSQGLVHRDIKPSNVLLEQGVERALLADFGLARAADDASVTRSGFHVGTPQYMSPEQARGEPIDARSDLFSLGSLLYTTSIGIPPFRAESSLVVLRRITDSEPPSMLESRPEIPVWFTRLVGRLMAKRPEHRFASAVEVSRLLEECLAHAQSPTRHPLPHPVRDPSRSIRSCLQSLRSFMEDKRILSLLALVLLLVAALAPWPMAAMGREFHALVFGGIAAGLALLFALLSRSQYFSRIVLWLVGSLVAIALLFGGVSLVAWNMRSGTRAYPTVASPYGTPPPNMQREAYEAMMEQSRVNPQPTNPYRGVAPGVTPVNLASIGETKFTVTKRFVDTFGTPLEFHPIEELPKESLTPITREHVYERLQATSFFVAPFLIATSNGVSAWPAPVPPLAYNPNLPNSPASNPAVFPASAAPPSGYPSAAFPTPVFKSEFPIYFFDAEDRFVGMFLSQLNDLSKFQNFSKLRDATPNSVPAPSLSQVPAQEPTPSESIEPGKAVNPSEPVQPNKSVEQDEPDSNSSESKPPTASDTELPLDDKPD
jgi:hypothetical protein